MTTAPQQPGNDQRPGHLAEIEERVRAYLEWETLETRKRDTLDFHEVSVATVRDVIRMAFDAGVACGARAPAPDPVLEAAKFVLGARQDDMLTLDEWLRLARAVADATGKQTADLLPKRDLEDIAEDYPHEWDTAVDGPLPKID